MLSEKHININQHKGDHDDALKLASVNWKLSEDGTFCSAEIRYCADNSVPEMISDKYQYLVIYAPAAYFGKDLAPDRSGKCCGHSADSAPVIFKNNCMGWNSSVPRDANMEWLSKGWIHVECGARSRDCDGENVFSKSPCQIVDLKSGLRMLRLNRELLPGDMDRVISYGFSGGGQMSSVLGASGNMEAYYPLLWENGAAGVKKLPDGSFESFIDDSVYGCMCFAPIAALQAASLAHAWVRFDSCMNGRYKFTEFQKQLEKDMAVRFCEYVNDLGLVNEEGQLLSFETDPQTARPDPRKGSYYDQTLNNLSDALNCFSRNASFPYTIKRGMRDNAEYFEYASIEDLLSEYYADGKGHVQNGTDEWIRKETDGSYSITDIAGLFHGTGLTRFKGIPAFDGLYWNDEKKSYGDGGPKGTENNAFGKPGQAAVHYSEMIAELIKDNYSKYSELEGFDAEAADRFIREASDPELKEQLYLMDSMQIMLNTARGMEKTDIAPFWRVRMGTEDQNSFAIAYDFAMAAQMAGVSVDYHLVWAMGHSTEEGSTTGTFAGWVSGIIRNDQLN